MNKRLIRCLNVWQTKDILILFVHMQHTSTILQVAKIFTLCKDELRIVFHVHKNYKKVHASWKLETLLMVHIKRFVYLFKPMVYLTVHFNCLFEANSLQALVLQSGQSVFDVQEKTLLEALCAMFYNLCSLTPIINRLTQAPQLCGDYSEPKSAGATLGGI